MIKAVSDKIVVDVMELPRKRGGIILPDTAKDPQAYGKVVSVGEAVTNISVGDILVFHPMAGQVMLMANQIMKVLKYEELYGILTDKEAIDQLEPSMFGQKKIEIIK